MFSSSLPAALCVALLFTADVASAIPGAGSAADADVDPPVKRMSIPVNPPPRPKSPQEIRSWARRQAQNLRRKYGAVGYEKRANSGSVPLTDANIDFQYFGSLQLVRVPFSYPRGQYATRSNRAAFFYFPLSVISIGNTPSDVQRHPGYR